MAEVVPNVPQEFWRAPVLEATPELASQPSLAETCAQCGSEFMIAAKFCHSCGSLRQAASLNATPLSAAIDSPPADELSGLWSWLAGCASVSTGYVAHKWRTIHFPAWMQYLHFHEIKRWVGLSTGSLVAFLIGLGCGVGALGVSLFFKASNLAEFQAIQMWRVQWLLAATAAFVAGILLKKPSGKDL